MYNVSIKIKYPKYKADSTTLVGCKFITVKDAMKLHQSLKSSSGSVIKIFDQGTNGYKEVQYFGMSPNHVLYLHDPDEFRSCFYDSPKIHAKDHNLHLF